MGIIKFDVYRNPNIGVFFQANDNFLISPPGVASSKISKMTKHLGVSNVSTSIGGSRLVGALTAMNSNGIIVSKLIEGFEEKLIVTLGSYGCRYEGKTYPVKKVSVSDVSGAGDTFIAGLVRGYLDTNDIYKSIKFAQKCTNIVIQKNGVSIVTLEEINEYESTKTVT